MMIVIIQVLGWLFLYYFTWHKRLTWQESTSRFSIHFLNRWNLFSVTVLG